MREFADGSTSFGAQEIDEGVDRFLRRRFGLMSNEDIAKGMDRRLGPVAHHLQAVPACQAAAAIGSALDAMAVTTAPVVDTVNPPVLHLEHVFPLSLLPCDRQRMAEYFSRPHAKT